MINIFFTIWNRLKNKFWIGFELISIQFIDFWNFSQFNSTQFCHLYKFCPTQFDSNSVITKRIINSIRFCLNIQFFFSIQLNSYNELNWVELNWSFFELSCPALPRLIMSLVSGCVDPSQNPWLYLCGYFISYLPPMLVFTMFILPSELYWNTFKDSMTRWRRQVRR